MQRVGVCLVGAGRAGLVHARNIASRIPTAELVGLCDANPEAVHEVDGLFSVPALYTNYEEAVTNPNADAVVIGTPTFAHRDIACAAAAAGKHIFLEKPMAIAVEECQDIIEAVKQTGVKLQLGFMRRFDQSFLRAKSIVDSGEMGRIVLIKSTGRGPGLPPPWIYDLGKSNGILAEVNSHDFDSLRWFVGSEVCRVYADGANFKCPEAKDAYPDFYDNAVVNLRFSDGTLGVVDGACPCHYGYDARVEILCEKGVVFVGNAQSGSVTRVVVDGEATGIGTVHGDSVRSWRNLFRDAYLDEMEHFVECVLEDREPRVTGTDGLKAVEIVAAANQSLRSGKPVALNEGA